MALSSTVVISSSRYARSAALARSLMTALVVAALMAALAGCTGSPATVASSLPADVPPRPQETVPARTAGDLTLRDLPAPEELGPGWQHFADPGNAEDGYVGNGTPAQARDPREVVAALRPLGCRTQPLPVPDRALEVSYRDERQTPAVGVLLAFDDDAAAQRFFQAHTGGLARCADDPRASTEVAVAASDPTRFVSTRTLAVGETPTWTETVELQGSRVLLLAVAPGS